MFGAAKTRSPDWVKCRNWLGQITPTSAKSVKQVSSERELFHYLRDGTELCRIVGVHTQGRVPEEMVYRTQNFSNLQQNNVALALGIIESEINKKHNKRINFGPRKEQALGNFDNFYAVLKGLSELSKYFEKKTNVKGFSIENKRGFRTPEIEKDIGMGSIRKYTTSPRRQKRLINFNPLNWQRFSKLDPSHRTGLLL